MRLLVNETQPYEWSRAGYAISTDRSRLDIDVNAKFLAEEAYWSAGVPRTLVEKAIAGSLAFDFYSSEGRQAGFARVVTDGAFFAYLRDVFVLSQHRGKGLGTWLAEAALTHPDLVSVKGRMLATDDAHGVYSNVGHPLKRPD